MGVADYEEMVDETAGNDMVNSCREGDVWIQSSWQKGL